MTAEIADAPAAETLLEMAAYLVTHSAGQGHWTRLAACVHEDPDLFFPESGNSGRPSPAVQRAVAEAKLVCSRCPVRAECLADGEDEPWGVWGGTDASERGGFRNGYRKSGAPRVTRTELRIAR